MLEKQKKKLEAGCIEFDALNPRSHWNILELVTSLSMSWCCFLCTPCLSFSIFLYKRQRYESL